MNEQEQADLAQLKARQARLEQELASLSTQLKQFEERLKTRESTRTQAPAQPTLAPGSPVAVGAAGIPKPAPAVKSGAVTPPPIPPVIPRPVVTTPTGTTPAGLPLKLRAEATEQKPFNGVCQVCHREISFPPTALSSTIRCPHCSQPTVLAIGPIPVAPPSPPQSVARPVASGGASSKPAEGSFE